MIHRLITCQQLFNVLVSSAALKALEVEMLFVVAVIINTV